MRKRRSIFGATWSSNCSGPIYCNVYVEGDWFCYGSPSSRPFTGAVLPAYRIKVLPHANNPDRRPTPL